MFATIQNGLRPALSAFSAALFLSLFTTPSPAQSPAALAAGQAGKATESITAAATVVSTAYYQATLTLTCGGTSCMGDFPAVAGKRRLNLTRVSCLMNSATYGVFTAGRVDLRTAGNVSSTVQFLPADYSTDFGYHSLNRAIDVQVRATQNARVLLFLASGGQATSAVCTAHGTLDVLQ